MATSTQSILLNQSTRLSNEKGKDQLPDDVTDPERRIYLAMLSAVDQSVSQVVKTLKQVGMYDNTLIVFTTDNGGSVSHAGSNYPLR